MAERAGVAEIVPGLLRIGGVLDLDGRLSWAPAVPGRQQPLNCYVRLDGDDATIIETGVSSLRPTIMEQLKAVVPEEQPILVFITRTELECSGNLSAITQDLNVKKVVFGGGGNPFDAYDEITRGSKAETVARQALPPAGDMVAPLAGSASLFLVPARLRILTTYWLYDKSTKTLFSSDIFGHTSIAPGGPLVIDRLEDDSTTTESAREHILAKFFWLPEARTELLSTWLEKVFNEIEVENLAPTHGVVLRGKALVEKHYNIVQEVLRSPTGN